MPTHPDDRHSPSHGHGHGHAHDQGLRGFLRYARLLPRMWKSPVSVEVVRLLAPARGETVLEIGGGMGPAMTLVARTGAKTVIVDPTPYMRRILGLRRLARLERGHIAIKDGAAESLPMPDASVDALFSVNTMHHWPHLERALSELHRTLRPGGRLVLVDEDFENPAHPEHRQFTQRHGAHGHDFTHIDPEAIAQTLLALGFSSASGTFESVAGRPAKVIRATK